MYRKQLEKTVVDQVLAEMNFNEHARAEEEPPQRLVELANRLHAKIESKTTIETEPQPEDSRRFNHESLE
jgi:hypothetical protein